VPDAKMIAIDIAWSEKGYAGVTANANQLRQR
jgi:hypothetical protein